MPAAAAGQTPCLGAAPRCSASEENHSRIVIVEIIIQVRIHDKVIVCVGLNPSGSLIATSKRRVECVVRDSVIWWTIRLDENADIIRILRSDGPDNFDGAKEVVRGGALEVGVGYVRRYLRMGGLCCQQIAQCE